MRDAATLCPRPCKLTFDLLTLKVVSESCGTWATYVPILVFLGLSVLDLDPMYTTDRQTDVRQTDVRRASSLNTRYPRGGGITRGYSNFVICYVCVPTESEMPHQFRATFRSQAEDCFTSATLCVSAVFAIVWYPSVRLSVRQSVTLVDCIHMAEDVVKLLVRPGSAITLVF